MKLKAGKRYVMRSGEVSGLLRETDHPVYSFADMNHAWCEDGSFWGPGGTPDLRDLIREYVAEKPKRQARKPAKKKSAAKKPAPKERADKAVALEWVVGRAYKTRAGKRVVLEWIDTDDPSLPYRFLNHGWRRADGRLWTNMDTDFDIIDYWPDEQAHANAPDKRMVRLENGKSVIIHRDYFVMSLPVLTRKDLQNLLAEQDALNDINNTTK